VVISSVEKVCLLTGKPGCGKTSLIKKLVSEADIPSGGFYTEEIRQGGERLGFRLVTLSGEEAVLAHTSFSKRYRVGKYGVDIASLEKIGVAALYQASATGKLVILDEIGKMELLSPAFRNRGNPVLGTIMLNSHPFANAIKTAPNLKLVNVTIQNRDALFTNLKEWLHKQAASQSKIYGG